jgi:hypothetical protein
MKIVFAPGSFDNFEGTQEELDSLIEDIKNLVESGRIFEESEPVDFDEMMEDDPELYQQLMKQMDNANSLNDGVHFIQENKKLN